MILRKALLYIAAAAALAAAAAVAVVAAAFALYAWMCSYFVPAGAAAVVPCVTALVFLIIGLSMVAKVRFRKPEPTLAERAADFARDRPIAALVAALGAGVVAVRNPKTVIAIVAALMEPKARRKS